MPMNGLDEHGVVGRAHLPQALQDDQDDDHWRGHLDAAAVGS
jgi:hypothetical protein